MVLIAFSLSSVILSSGDVFWVYKPRETGTFLFPVGVRIEIVCDGLIDCRQTVFDVAAFHIEDGILFVIFPIPVIGMGQEGM